MEGYIMNENKDRRRDGGFTGKRVTEKGIEWSKTLCNKEKKQGRKAEEKHNLVKAKKSQETVWAGKKEQQLINKRKKLINKNRFRECI